MLIYVLEVSAFNFTAAHILNCCLGVVMYTYYAVSKNWIVSNIFGLAVAFNSLEVHLTPDFTKLLTTSISNLIRLWLASFFLGDYSFTIYSSCLEQTSWSPSQ